MTGAYWPRGFEPNYEHYFGLKQGLVARSRKGGAPRCGV
jgi:hypothetical protein